MGSGDGRGRRAGDLLECWRAIELFSPPSIPEVPRKRRVGRPRASDPVVVDVTPAAGQAAALLPWSPEHPETAARRAPRGMVWRHEVYGGVFEVERLRQAMIAVLPAGTDPDPGVPQEELKLSGRSAMFALVLDEHGRPVEETSVVSACAWATGRLFDPGPSTPGWLDGFEELGEAFEVAVGQLAAAPIRYAPGARPLPNQLPYSLPNPLLSRPVGGTVPGRTVPGRAGAEPTGGWRQLLAEVLGGAAVAAVGALFGEVAGAAVQGATEPLVRRVAEWSAVRRTGRQDAEGPGAAAEPQPSAAVPSPSASPATVAPVSPDEPGGPGGPDGPDGHGPDGTDGDTGARPVELADLVALTAQIAHLCGVEEHLDPRVIRVQSRLVRLPRDPKAKAAAPQPFLNSFLPPDLARVGAALADSGGEGLGPALEAYLTARQDIPVAARTDLLVDRLTVLEGVDPALVPAGRWPAKARYPLALSQQFAVNRMLADRATGTTATAPAPDAGGLFSVNGPPGTGKTTMLRDLVAALVVERAAVLAGYRRPEEAFVGRAWRGKDRQGVHARFVSALDPRLTGREIVVTSSNNGAVENITAELPGATALDEHWHGGPDHFSDLASALLGGAPAWGLVAAVLGNKTNRTRFTERFWWGRLPEDENAVRTAAGLPPLRGMNAVLGDWVPPSAPRPTARTPRDRRTATAPATVTAPPAAPAEPAEPVPSWPEAVAAFRAAQAEVERLRAERARLATALATTRSDRLDADLGALSAAVVRADERVAAARTRSDAAATAVETGASAVRTAEAAHEAADRGVSRARQALEEARSVLAVARERADQHRRQVDTLTALHDEPPTAQSGLRAGLRRMLRSEAERQAAEQHRERSQAELLALLVEQHTALADANGHIARCVRAEEQAAAELRTRSTTDVTAAATAADFARALERAALTEESAAHEALQRARQDARTALQELESAVARVDAAHRSLREAAETLPSLPLDWLHLDDHEQELGAPWADEAWSTARSDLFLRALDLHRAFVANTAKRIRSNLQVLVELMAGTNGPVPDEQVLHAWQTLFLLVPVVSTTFSSIGSMFARLGRGSLGWVLVDEAGQATPQAAVGALWRARRAVLVGDPLQLEPVVTMPSALQRRLLLAHGVDEEWLPSATSAQAVADRVNRYGTYLPAPTGAEDETVWVGSPLRVHRRCEEPMFTVSNEVAYGGLMVYGTHPQPFPDPEHDGLLPSRWLDTPDPERPADAPWGERDRRALTFLLSRLDRHEVGVDRLRIIAPFRALVREARDTCRTLPGWSAEHLDERCATVHKAQGKEADVVILLLGAGRRGARAWAAGTPHLLNVAASRAKRRLYVVGDRALWAPLLHFDVLADELPVYDHIEDRDTWPLDTPEPLAPPA
ncbi:AAA domain-containing protein [Kitasatospora sp. NPDC096140]|uniref:AAA domain-containing protein n=1 Tax=Kitasatospora sp. NPDC096140 TaxID=3155425 RepID=UPI00331E328E